MAYCYVVFAALALSSIFQALILSTTQAQPLPWQLCNTSSGNYTENSTYKANIEYLATSLPQYASSSPSLFAYGSSGTSPDVIYAIALCRGDTNASTCATCVAAAIREAGKLCPLVKSVTIYDDPCILRFSEQSFPISPPYDKGMLITWSFDNVSAAVAPSFDAATARLANATVEYAAADPIRRFGTGEAAFDDETYPKIYSLAQCTPDMTADECRSCLWYIIGSFQPLYFAGKHGGRVLGVRCNYRFETYPFFYGRPLLQLQPPNGPSPAPASQATRADELGEASGDGLGDEEVVYTPARWRPARRAPAPATASGVTHWRRTSERRGGRRQQEEMAHGSSNSSALVATREEDGDKSLPIDGNCMVKDMELKRYALCLIQVSTTKGRSTICITMMAFKIQEALIWKYKIMMHR